jgi:hypothetical protein
MTRSRVAFGLKLLGGAALLASVGWWWVVFRTLIGNASMTVQGALPCLAHNSDLCTLAQALCASQHFLGIRHYDTLLFWAGTAIIGVSLLPTFVRRDAVSDSAA